MLKPMNQNLLLKKVEQPTGMIFMPKEESNFYEVVCVSDELDSKLIGKKVVVLENLKKIEYQEDTYYLVNIKEILAVEE